MSKLNYRSQSHSTIKSAESNIKPYKQSVQTKLVSNLVSKYNANKDQELLIKDMVQVYMDTSVLNQKSLKELEK